jgi:Flp pilus assembly protein protease CpaA
MYKPFFPDPLFGWAFYLVLVGLTAIASYTDLRKMVVPNWLTVTALALGLVFSIARGCWLGAQGHRLWVLATGSAWLGGLDGLLFALAGSCFAFAVFFLFWILGTCGGGDLKLFTALGAWVGPILFLFLLAGSLVVLFVILFLRILKGGLTPSAIHRLKNAGRDKGAKPRRWRMTYSLPVAISTALVLLWIFRVDLQLAEPHPPHEQQVQTHAH